MAESRAASEGLDFPCPKGGTWAPGARPYTHRFYSGSPGGVPPPPIPAKTSFVFSDIGDFLGRNYLILREMTCRYLSTKELRVLLNGSGAAEGGEPLPVRFAGVRCAIPE